MHSPQTQIQEHQTPSRETQRGNHSSAHGTNPPPFRLQALSEQTKENEEPDKRLIFQVPLEADMLAWPEIELQVYAFSRVLRRPEDEVRRLIQEKQIQVQGLWQFTSEDLKKGYFRFYILDSVYSKYASPTPGLENIFIGKDGVYEGQEQRSLAFRQLSENEREQIIQEADRRFEAIMGWKPEGPLPQYEDAHLSFWLRLRDEIILQREQLKDSAPMMELLIKVSNLDSISPADYGNLLKLSGLISQMDERDMEIYQQRQQELSANWGPVSKSIESFLGKKARVKSQIFDLMSIKDPVHRAKQLSKLDQEGYQYLNIFQRIVLLEQSKHLSSGQIIRLLSTIAPGDAAPLLKLLSRDQYQLLRSYHAKMSGEDLRQYYSVLVKLYFQASPPSATEAGIENAPILPWADPGLLGTYGGRNYHYELRWREDGKLDIFYISRESIIPVGGQTYTLDPFSLVGIRFERPEEYAGAEEDSLRYVPAIFLLSLKDKQQTNQMHQYLEMGSLMAGGVGLLGASSRSVKMLAALDLAWSLSDQWIQEHRYQLTSSAAGRMFLNTWDTLHALITIYTLGRVALELPHLFRQLAESWREVKKDIKDTPEFRRVNDQVEQLLQTQKLVKPAKYPSSRLPKISSDFQKQILPQLSRKELKLLSNLEDGAIQEIGHITDIDEIRQITKLMEEDVDIANDILAYHPYRGYEGMEEAFRKQQRRVRGPVQAVYTNSDLQKLVKEWDSKEDVNAYNSIHSISSEQIEANLYLTKRIVDSHTGKDMFVRGGVQRIYDIPTNTLIMKEAFLKHHDSFFKSERGSLTDRGTPSITYITLGQMNLMEIPRASLNKVKMERIRNIDTILQLEWLKQKYGTAKSEDYLIYFTHSVQYAETIINQSGHRIREVKINRTGNIQRLGRLMKYHERRDPTEREAFEILLKKYGFERSDWLYADFTIEFTVEPYLNTLTR